MASKQDLIQVINVAARLIFRNINVDKASESDVDIIELFMDYHLDKPKDDLLVDRLVSKLHTAMEEGKVA